MHQYSPKRSVRKAKRTRKHTLRNGFVSAGAFLSILAGIRGLCGLPWPITLDPAIASTATVIGTAILNFVSTLKHDQKKHDPSK